MYHLHEYEADSQEASAVIRTNIYRIRQKLTAVSSQREIIKTVRGVGYTLQSSKKAARDKELIDGRYRLLELLGQGATATVYRAYQESLERYVAIKFLRATLQENDGFRERFQREARHAASLQHPNIIQVYDFGRAIGSNYIVMEYIEGQTLQERLSELAGENQKMPLPEVLRIVRETGQALSYAHQQGMIHRDVKPDNIMMRADGRVALMDFGLAKLVAAPHLTAEGEISGTPNYMAPEHIQGGDALQEQAQRQSGV
jgi:serine/threonine-protein kinase